MLKWGNYIGLFSGILFIILGIALRYLPVPATAPWMQEVVPYFLIGYGILRIGMSLYFLRRARQKNVIPLILLALSLWHCKRGGPEENLRVRFPYDGECASCPLNRMDSLLRYHFPKAVVEVSYDSTQQEVVLNLDSNYVRLDTLIQTLLAYGYEVNDQLPSDPILSACCTPIEAAIRGEGSLFAEANPREEVSLLEQELEAQLSEEPPLPQEDLSLDDDLGDLENFDISDGGGEPGLDEGLDDLGLDDDLDLELEPRPKKNTSQQKNVPQKP